MNTGLLDRLTSPLAISSFGGYLKEEVYKQGPQPNLAALETAIRGGLQAALPDFFFRACNSSISRRIEELRKRGGGQIEHSF